MQATQVTKMLTGSVQIVPYNGEFPDLLNGNGARTASVHVDFPPKSFQSAPQVAVSINGLDINNNHGLRIQVSAANADQNGFNLVFFTWADTQVNLCSAAWVAFE